MENDKVLALSVSTNKAHRKRRNAKAYPLAESKPGTKDR